MPAYHIRPYEARDHAACLAIFNSNLPLYFDPTELQALENWLRAKDEGRMAYVQNRLEQFYVLETKGKVQACGGFYLPENKRLVNMVWGMVEAGSHKQGLGQALLDYRVQQAMQLFPGYSITLDTSQHTYRFFERLGFIVTSRSRNHYGPGLHRYDMVLKRDNC